MTISIREMKKKLKNELPVGTFVNDEVYQKLREAADEHLTNLCREIALAFAESEDRVLRVSLVTEVMAGDDYDSN